MADGASRGLREGRAAEMEQAGLLEGQAAVVPEAGQGVGAGIARALAAAGASVVVATRRGETGEPTAAAIRAEGNRAAFVRCDVTEPGDVSAAVAAAVECFGGLDVMVHNAVSRPGPPRPLQRVDDRVIGEQTATSVRAAYLCARAAWGPLRQRPGSLILLTSPAAVEGSANLPVYAAVKAAQRGILKNLAREWGPHGIRVNAIAPPARTPAMVEAIAANPALEARNLARGPARGQNGERRQTTCSPSFGRSASSNSSRPRVPGPMDR